jgi:hypothetical protein
MLATGGRGNDTLRGGQGADTYIYNLGDGDDYIYDYDGNDADRLVLGLGIGPGDVTLARSASDLDDLMLSFAGGGSVFLNEQFNSKHYASTSSTSPTARRGAGLQCWTPCCNAAAPALAGSCRHRLNGSDTGRPIRSVDNFAAHI